MTDTGFQNIPPAYIKGDLLIVTAHDSVSPVLWQMDRATLRTAGFDVVQVGEHWQLRFKPFNDNPRDIAHYRDRNGAIALLTHIQSAIMGGTSSFQPKMLFMKSPSPRVEQLILAGVAVLLFTMLSVMLFRLIPSPATSSSPAVSSVPVEPGVPQSADDLLLQQGGQ